MHSGTFLNFLELSGTFWKFLDFSGTVWNMLEYSVTFWNILDVVEGRKVDFQVDHTHADRRTDKH